MKCSVLVGGLKENNYFCFIIPKWTDNLLPINNLQSEKNYVFKLYLIFSTSLIRYDPVWRGAILQFISPGSEMISFSATNNFLFERYWNHLMTDYLYPIHSIFCKSTVPYNASKAFRRSTRIIPVWEPLPISR